MNEKHDLTSGSIPKKLLGFFFPIFLGLLFQQLYNTIDAVIVGQFVGALALAAVGGSASVITSSFIAVFLGLASGATVVISQYIGARDYDGVSRATHTAIALSIILGVLITIVFEVFARDILVLLHEPADIIDMSVLYIRYYFAGIIPMMVFNVGSGILRAAGDSKRPLYFLIACCVLNILLDLVFVAALGMGVRGVALATALSFLVSSILVIVSLARSNESYKLYIRKIAIDRPVLEKTMRIGIPAAIQSSMYGISNLIIQIYVNDFGSMVVAAWTATGKFDGIFWITSNALGVAISGFVGQCYGAGLYERMKEGIRYWMRTGVIISVSFSVLLMSLSRWGLRLITPDAEVIDLGVEILRYFVPYYFVWIFVGIYSNALRGMGDSLIPMIIVVVGVCFVRISWLIIILPLYHTVRALSYSYAVSWGVTAVAIVIYYNIKKRKLLELQKTRLDDD